MTLSKATIRPFRPGDEDAFVTLNEQWISAFFKLEEKDREAFADPQGTIIEKGGEILLAIEGQDVAGCCALVRISADAFEVAKMAVSPLHQGRGIGRQVLTAAIHRARERSARRLYLETNHILTAAIHLYESVGFKRLNAALVQKSPYERADVYMELSLES